MFAKMFGARRIAALERQLDELRVEFATLRADVRACSAAGAEHGDGGDTLAGLAERLVAAADRNEQSVALAAAQEAVQGRLTHVEHVAKALIGDHRTIEKAMAVRQEEISALRSTLVALERQVERQARDAGELATGLMAQLARSKLQQGS